MRAKWFVLLLVLLLASSFLIGCGGSKDKDTTEDPNGVTAPVNGDNGDDPDNGDSDNGDPDNGETGQPGTVVEGWLDFGTFVKVVVSAQWVFDEGTVYYKNEGPESVGGVPTEKISVVYHDADWGDESLVMWVDAAGNVVKAEVDGEPAFDDELAYMHEFAIPPLIPFYADGEPGFTLSFTQAMAGHSSPGWNVIDMDKSKGIVGGKSVDLYIVEVESEDWAIKFTYADFGPYKLLVGWEDVDGSASDIFKTESLVFR